MIENKIMKEKISALADGELSDFETRRILSEISTKFYSINFYETCKSCELNSQGKVYIYV